MKRLTGFLITILLMTPLTSPAGESLDIAVAANVKYAFDDIAAAFHRQTGIQATGIVASSGKLTAQIKNGAPFDVFMAADMKYPQSLYHEGFAKSTPEIYAYGALVLWTREALNLGKGMELLAEPQVQRIALANPRLAPFGRAAVKALEHYGLSAKVKHKLVYGENIGQVSQYIDGKTVDIGFTAKSIVLAPESAGRGKWIEVPKESYEPIAQGMIILRHSVRNNASGARQFRDFVRSPPGRAILEKYGYSLP